MECRRFLMRERDVLKGSRVTGKRTYHRSRVTLPLLATGEAPDAGGHSFILGHPRK